MTDNLVALKIFIPNAQMECVDGLTRQLVEHWNIVKESFKLVNFASVDVVQNTLIVFFRHDSKFTFSATDNRRLSSLLVSNVCFLLG